MKAEVVPTDGGYYFRFQYNPTLLASVKKLPAQGRFFRGPELGWYIPERFKNDLWKLCNRYRIPFGTTPTIHPENVGEIPELPALDRSIALKKTLRHYQEGAVAFNIKNERTLNGDDMGLGKTAETIASVEALEAYPCLVICPNTLKDNWRNEFHDWTSRKALVLSDKVSRNLPLYYESGLAHVFVVNYESLERYFVRNIDKKGAKNLKLEHVEFHPVINFFRSVVIDESHKVKNAATKAAKFCKGIATGKRYVFALSGTPAINSPSDLLSQLSILSRMPDFGGAKYFAQRYCAGVSGSSNLKELNWKLWTTCYFRREKQTVLTELPPKSRRFIICDIATRREYNDALLNLENYLQQYKQATSSEIARAMRGEIMVRIGILKQISARGKIKDLLEFIDDTLENGEKLVVFAHHSEVVDAIFQHYPGVAVKVTGKVSPEDRTENVKAFQENESVRLIICTLNAGGVGITLTAASNVVFIELGWHAAIHDQAEDRCNRLGQRNAVTATYLLGRDTIDQWVYSIIDSKREMADTITGSETKVEEEIIDGLWKQLSNPKTLETTN